MIKENDFPVKSENHEVISHCSFGHEWITFSYNKYIFQIINYYFLKPHRDVLPIQFFEINGVLKMYFFKLKFIFNAY